MAIWRHLASCISKAQAHDIAHIPTPTHALANTYTEICKSFVFLRQQLFNEGASMVHLRTLSVFSGCLPSGPAAGTQPADIPEATISPFSVKQQERG